MNKNNTENKYIKDLENQIELLLKDKNINLHNESILKDSSNNDNFRIIEELD